MKTADRYLKYVLYGYTVMFLIGMLFTINNGLSIWGVLNFVVLGLFIYLLEKYTD